MDIFALDKHVIDDYQEFARSCVTIRTADLRQQIDDTYRCPRPGLRRPAVRVGPDRQSRLRAELDAWDRLARGELR